MTSPSISTRLLLSRLCLSRLFGTVSLLISLLLKTNCKCTLLFGNYQNYNTQIEKALKEYYYNIMYTRACASLHSTQLPSLPSGASPQVGVPFPPVVCLFSPRVAFPSPPVAFPPLGLPAIPSGSVHCCTTAMETCGRHVEKSGLRGACCCPKPPLWCPKPRESQKNRFFLKKSGENICLFQKAVVILHRFSAHEDLFRVERFF